MASQPRPHHLTRSRSARRPERRHLPAREEFTGPCSYSDVQAARASGSPATNAPSAPSMPLAVAPPARPARRAGLNAERDQGEPAAQQCGQDRGQCAQGLGAVPAAVVTQHDVAGFGPRTAGRRWRGRAVGSSRARRRPSRLVPGGGCRRWPGRSGTSWRAAIGRSVGGRPGAGLGADEGERRADPVGGAGPACRAIPGAGRRGWSGRSRSRAVSSGSWTVRAGIEAGLGMDSPASSTRPVIGSAYASVSGSSALLANPAPTAQPKSAGRTKDRD
jgi:hypothetical protein